MPCYSVLEALPLELLKKVFIYSYNSNLAFTSRYLFHSLSSPSLPCRMTVAILLSRSASAQTDLLRRRFFDLVVYDEACKIIEAQILASDSSKAYFMQDFAPFSAFDPTPFSIMDIVKPKLCAMVKLEPDVMLCERLVAGFGPDERQGSVCGLSTFWINTILPLTAFNDALLVRAQQGLHELVVAGNLKAAGTFLTLRFFTDEECHDLDYKSGVWVRPLEETFIYAIVETDWLSLDLIWQMGNTLIMDGVEFPPVLEAWCKKRQESDRKSRACLAGHLHGPEWVHTWVGTYLERMCYNLLRGRSTEDYGDSFFHPVDFYSSDDEGGPWPHKLQAGKDD
ncbi:MAG: hypothetical protein M1829_002628 [Trizodia sp. TS-e1964]|nr:MAG: hypothetical protein M1829_002628 [Trizodia sp. TS-e1964]